MRSLPFLLATLLLLAPGPLSALSFTSVTTGPVVTDTDRSTGGAWEDYDADGDPDLFVSNGNISAGNNALYRNDGGTFHRVTTGPVGADNTSSIGGTWGDYDADGDPDLFVANRQGVDNLFYRNDGTGFVRQTTGVLVTEGGNSNASSWVDLDADGELDLFVINFLETNRHYRNNGDGTFTPQTVGDYVTDVTFSISGVWGDYDADGDQDLFISNGGSQDNLLYRNDGGGSFADVSASAGIQHGSASIGCSWGDIDNDEDLDLFVANTLGQSNLLYTNNGDGTFTRVLTGPVVTDGGNSTGSAFADLDNDGDQDLYVGNDGGVNFLYRNDGSSFTRILTGDIATDPGATFGVSCADFDSDGWMDVFAANRSLQTNDLYRNDAGSNHWLQVKLLPTLSNKSAIGARVVAFATLGGSPVSQLREMSSQTGYNSRNDPRLHFGLADAVLVDSLQVTWPSGLVETVYGALADQVVELVEGATVTSASLPDDPSAAAELSIRPNPSRGPAWITLVSPRRSATALRILDVRGRIVRILLAERVRSSGRRTVVWDGRTASGALAASGVYFAVGVVDGQPVRDRIVRIR